MKRKQLPLVSLPLKSLRPSGSAHRYYSLSIEERFNQMPNLVSVISATQSGNVELIRYHVENSAVAYREAHFGPYKRNLLHLAAMSNNIEAIKYIIDQDLGDPLEVDSHESHPYQLAKGGAKEYLKKFTVWRKRRALILWYSSCGNKKIPVGIVRQICTEHFGL